MFINLYLLMTAIVLVIYFIIRSPYFRCLFSRSIRILIRKGAIDRNGRHSTHDTFSKFYHQYLCHLQKTNTDLLGNILQANQTTEFFRDRSISYLSSHPPKQSEHATRPAYSSVDEFRAQVPLTTYADYAPYVSRMVDNGEKNLISTEDVAYYAASSGTTANIKHIPATWNVLKNMNRMLQIGWSIIWRSFPATAYPSSERRLFYLTSAKKSEMFPKSKDQIPIGPISQYQCIVSPVMGMKLVVSSQNVISLNFLEQISHFETSLFVQLVFALTIPDILSYTVPFAPGFLHTIKIIQSYYEEISQCIVTGNFDQSSFVRENISDINFRLSLGEALQTMALEYGGEAYRIRRALSIRYECMQHDSTGLLHRLWPQLLYAATTTGGSFAMYKEELKGLCGNELTLINLPLYAASEGFFGVLASIHTDEYILSPTSAFFEFIKEEDIHQDQPKTYLLSEIEPGNRYEMVITTEAGLIRYRMGDVINCTRYLSHSHELVPLPRDIKEVPRVPLISVAYRVGSLLDVFGEKTSEQHVMNAIQETVQSWSHENLSVQMTDFTSYVKLDVLPSHYVIFLEINYDSKEIKDERAYLEQLQMNINEQLEYQLCQTNHKYEESRRAGKLGPLSCILVQQDTFSTFLYQNLLTKRVSPSQIKPHRKIISYTSKYIQKVHIQFNSIFAFSVLIFNSKFDEETKRSKSIVRKRNRNGRSISNSSCTGR